MNISSNIKSSNDMMILNEKLIKGVLRTLKDYKGHKNIVTKFLQKIFSNKVKNIGVGLHLQRIGLTSIPMLSDHICRNQRNIYKAEIQLSLIW